MTVSYVAVDGQLVAAFCLADAMRAGAGDVIRDLQKLGIASVMLTGDNEQTAAAVAGRVGITQFHTRVLPDQKAQQVQQLQALGKRVAMVGDGVNDAPALAAAHVGIAMGGGTAVALESAGTALLRNDLGLIPKLIRLSRATGRNIVQNLIWAFGYNVLLIPVAMGVLYPMFGVTINPMLAGLAMAFSSLSVVLNSLRLWRVTL